MSIDIPYDMYILLKENAEEIGNRRREEVVSPSFDEPTYIFSMLLLLYLVRFALNHFSWFHHRNTKRERITTLIDL